MITVEIGRFAYLSPYHPAMPARIRHLARIRGASIKRNHASRIMQHERPNARNILPARLSDHPRASRAASAKPLAQFSTRALHPAARLPLQAEPRRSRAGRSRTERRSE